MLNMYMHIYYASMNKIIKSSDMRGLFFAIKSKASKVRYDIPRINGLYRLSFIDVLSRYPFFRPVGARLQDLAPA